MGLVNKILNRAIYFPSINFGLISAEIMPYGMMYYILHVRRTSIWLTFLVAFLSLSAIYGVFRTGSISAYEIFRSMFAYLNPVLLFVAILMYADNSVILKNIEFNRKLLIFLIILGIFQFSGLIYFLDPILKFLVPRASAESLGFRGVTLLSTEPARASVELLFIYIVFDRTARPSFYLKAALFLFYLFCLRSATGLAVLTIYLFLSDRAFRRISILSGFVLVNYFSITIEGRVGNLISEVVKMPLDDALFYLSNTSGNRAISIYLSWLYSIENPFGGGIGQWKISSVESISLAGIDYTKYNYFNLMMAENKDLYFRSSGFFSNLAMDLGLMGVVCFTILLWKSLKLNREAVIYFVSSQYSVVIIFLITIFFVGSVGVLAPWITLSLLYRWTSEKVL